MSENIKTSKKEKLFFSGAIFIGLVPFLFIVYLLMGPLARIVYKDYTGTSMYIISDKLKIRSEKGKNAYIIGSYKYGTEVTVYEEIENKWAEVSVEEKKGYMSLEYLVTPETFYLIDGMYGNENAKKLISKTIYRKAISSYLSENNFTTDISNQIKKELYGKQNKKEIWLLFANKKNSRFNTFSYGDYNGDQKEDAAFILKNVSTGKRKLIVLDLNVDVPGKYSKLLYSQDINNDWLFIRNATKNKKYIINNQEQKSQIDGILIGGFRDKSFNDINTLLLYNGKDFKAHQQTETGQ